VTSHLADRKNGEGLTPCVDVDVLSTRAARRVVATRTASGHQFTVRALAYITAGHVIHHVTILKQQYLSVLRAPSS